MSFPKSLFLLLLLLPTLTWAQQRPAARPATPATPPQGQRIELLPGAGKLVGGTFNGVEIRKIIGNVSFRQGTTLLYCDSAYQYTERNALEAFSNVRIIQNDTITITGNRGTYDGDTRKARMTGNVTMRDPRMTLTTQLLDYDLNQNLAYYSTGGHLQDPENTLDSQFGYYNTQSKVFSFKRNVKLVTKENNIDTDTLQYNTVSKIAYFFGPTRIRGKQGNLYAENGTYNTITKVSNFARNARIETPNYLLGGDKLFYDEARQYGVATGHVSMTSKKDNLVIRGDVGRYWRTQGRAKVYGSRPVMRNISDRDTLYLTADTLVSVEGRPPQNKAGVIYAYRKVAIFRADLQGRCDSLTYDRQDSVIYLSHDPVLWNQRNQLTADSIQIQQRRGQIDQMRLYGHAFSIGQDTLLNFNQVKGRYMVAYFRDKSIKKIDVLGNAESLYYALEGDTAVSGVNKSLSATMALRFADSKLQTISFLTNPEASFIPPNELKPEDAKLKDFRWRATERPTRRQTLGKHFAPPAKPKKKAAPVKKKTVSARKTTPKKPASTKPKSTAKPAQK
ncbi:lipopolysaccharide export system protein LptA [Hymenobacter luteus]|uniref:Lipopolysaccharide export system protein LptA n=2 Tax=Hymenobacter TaxID=89966 RepID=A0A7W9WBM2_9BACT|nr:MULTISPECIES: OstA-like protein [Hymenobacter]MBB4600655.1 lipopolysaccharide export system protein LptA [Hymenobacter latericoloratus]MBB6059138.1 lipopolysaccharide export system protein LptA [Hymenobacter luteus]